MFDKASQRFCAAMGPLGVLLFFAGIYPMARFLPPLAPSLGADAVAAVYRQHGVGIRFGAMAIMISAMMMMIFTVPLTLQMWRMGPGVRALAVCQIAASAVEAVFIVLPALAWSVAALRPDRPVELVRLISDLGWLLLVMPAPPAMVQVAAFGAGVLRDRRASPLMPRWLGYYSLWAALGYAPGLLVPLFLTGPFAWNGLISFWFVAVDFGLWYIVMIVPVMRAIGREDA